MIAIVRWEAPPPPYRGNTTQPRTDHDAIAAALRARPMQWALVAVDTHAATASAITAGTITAYRPHGTYEAVSRIIGGRVHIYARHVGTDPVG